MWNTDGPDHILVDIDGNVRQAGLVLDHAVATGGTGGRILRTEENEPDRRIDLVDLHRFEEITDLTDRVRGLNIRNRNCVVRFLKRN